MDAPNINTPVPVAVTDQPKPAVGPHVMRIASTGKISHYVAFALKHLEVRSIPQGIVCALHTYASYRRLTLHMFLP